MADLTSVISRWASDITVERRGVGYFIRGKFCERDPSNFCPLACVQPMGPREAQLLPEGIRAREIIKIYSREKLLAAHAKTETSADVVIYQDRRFEVHKSTDWDDHGGYYKSIAFKVGQ